MEYDAFSAGVEPGGLRSQSEIRLLLCYLLKSVDLPLSRSMILSVIQDSGLANYFEAAAALEELSESGSLIVAENSADPTYRIAQQGAMVADTLAERLPVSVREKSVSAALSLLSRTRREQENKVVFQKQKKGLVVQCHISDGDSDMMSIDLRVPDLLQAELVKKRFQSDPSAFYTAVLALLTGDPYLLGELQKELAHGASSLSKPSDL
ncbi:MAG: DUF4364 family protein [Firmicutes bacterium]|nr:DUF4364 family protein [Bacillota bacterium]